MAYTPLTPEQFQKAKAAGYSGAQITAMEQKRKASMSGEAGYVAPQEPERGFFGQLLVDTLKSGARVAATGYSALESAGGLTKSLYQKAVGADADAQKTLDDLAAKNKRISEQGYDMGYLGNIKTLRDPLDAAAAGVDIASNLPMIEGAGITFDILKQAVKGEGKRALFRSAVPLMKQGALSAGMSSVGTGVQEQKDPGQIALEGIASAGVGAIAGPLFGIGGAVIGKALSKTNIGKLKLFQAKDMLPNPKELKVVSEAVRSPLDAFEKAKLKTAGAESGYDSLFSKKKYALLPEDEARGWSVKDLYNPSDDINVNRARILQASNEIGLNKIAPLLAENPRPFQGGDLVTFLNKNVVPSYMILKGSDNQKIFEAIKNKGMRLISQFPKDMQGIQDARKALDIMIEKNFGPAFWDMNLQGGAKDAAAKLRTALNDFTFKSIQFRDMNLFNKAEDYIAKQIRKGTKFNSIEDVRAALMNYYKKGSKPLAEDELKALWLRGLLRDQHLKLEAANNLWEQGALQIGKTRFQNIQNPHLKQIIGYGALGAAGALGGAFGASSIERNTN